MTSPPNLNELRALAESALPDAARAIHALHTCVDFYVKTFYEHKDDDVEAELERTAPVAHLLRLVVVANPEKVIALIDEIEKLRELAVTPMQRAADLDQAVCEETANLRSQLASERNRADEHLKHRDTLEHQLAAMTAARDEACELAEAYASDKLDAQQHVYATAEDDALCARAIDAIQQTEVTRERIQQLRSIGKDQP